MTKISIGGYTRLIYLRLLSKDLIFFITKLTNIIKSRGELIFKFFSSRLNTRPYNKLSKKVGDYKDE